jgi:hypothetical protein
MHYVRRGAYVAAFLAGLAAHGRLEGWALGCLLSAVVASFVSVEATLCATAARPRTSSPGCPASAPPAG